MHTCVHLTGPPINGTGGLSSSHVECLLLLQYLLMVYIVLHDVRCDVMVMLHCDVECGLCINTRTSSYNVGMNGVIRLHYVC